MFKKSIHFYCNIEALQSPPDTFCTGHTITFSSHVAANNTNHPYRLLHGGRLFRRHGSFAVVTAQRFPLDILEKYRARVIRHSPSKHRHVIDAPCNDHIHAKACLKPGRRSQLSVFDSASCFQRAMIHLYPPTARNTTPPVASHLQNS